MKSSFALWVQTKMQPCGWSSGITLKEWAIADQIQIIWWELILNNIFKYDMDLNPSLYFLSAFSIAIFAYSINYMLWTFDFSQAFCAVSFWHSLSPLSCICISRFIVRMNLQCVGCPENVVNLKSCMSNQLAMCWMTCPRCFWQPQTCSNERSALLTGRYTWLWSRNTEYVREYLTMEADLRALLMGASLPSNVLSIVTFQLR